MIWLDLPVLCNTIKHWEGNFWGSKPVKPQWHLLLLLLSDVSCQTKECMFPLPHLSFCILQLQNFSDRHRILCKGFGKFRFISYHLGSVWSIPNPFCNITTTPNTPEPEQLSSATQRTSLCILTWLCTWKFVQQCICTMSETHFTKTHTIAILP